MKEQTDLRAILKKGVLSDELDLERALILDRKLRLIVKEHPELIPERAKLRKIIQSYEKDNWSNNSKITDAQIKESDDAEFIAETERMFLERRKEKIKESLSHHKLNQQHLGKILGHSKSYMSELINGVSPFSTKDLIILHRLFHIQLEYLIPTIISHKDILKVKKSLIELNKPDLRIEKDDLLLV